MGKFIGERIIYLDAIAGISGDMFLGAMTDIAGQLDPNFDLGSLLAKISIDEYDLSVTRGKRASITGLKVDVHPRRQSESEHAEHGARHHRNLSDISEILRKSDISREVRERALSAFTLLAETEGRVHGISPEEVCFHEIGAVDSIVDIIGAMLIMESLGWPRLRSSPVNVGSGTVRCAHGILPVPAPAAALLLQGMEIYSAGEPVERTTPTGALLIRILVGSDGFRPLPCGRIMCIGTGLGGRDTPNLPNALRAILYEPSEIDEGKVRFARDEVSLLASNIDDMNPQDFGLVMERLLDGGALDVWCENILMKKGRPAVKLCCLTKRGDEERVAEIILKETTTIGVRVVETDRYTLWRNIEELHTSCGDVRFKSVSLDGKTLRCTPEYDDLLEIAREKNLPLHEIRKIILRDVRSNL
ncbi:MAG: nickel pincer cofactor biosynthesis protein LarC [Synergistaceae bacterium]|nr:nickel pincer cofactor biosynthesis protein LarC [Synergistaceae bacterium]